MGRTPALLLALVFACDSGRSSPGGSPGGGTTTRRDASIAFDAGIGADAGAPRDAGRTDGGGAASGDRFCTALVDARCQGNLRCCMRADQTYTSLQACRDGELPRCRMLFAGAAFDDGRVRVDEAALSRLVSAYNTAIASCGSVDDAMSLAVFVGTAPAGSDCTAAITDLSPAFSCAPGLACRVSETSRVATCERVARLGASCASAPCEAGTICDSTAASPICIAPRANGQPCQAESECRSGQCSTARTCVPETAEHQYCLRPPR